MRFIDLFAGLGGFHKALVGLDHECVFACEINETLRNIYTQNFPEVADHTYGDIRQSKAYIPAHDILCAGFPCQPFSKSGYQLGVLDTTRGTLFHEILLILKTHKPEYLILENVGNFEQHDDGRTWQIVRQGLEELGYDVKGTVHVKNGGSGLLSPHHLGYPQQRDRFFIVGHLHSEGGLPDNPFPIPDRKRITDVNTIIQSGLTPEDIKDTMLSDDQVSCIEHWNAFLKFIPKEEKLPSFPLWADEIDATYPFEDNTPYHSDIGLIIQHLENKNIDIPDNREDIVKLLPKYARDHNKEFPIWKKRFIRQNRIWFQSIRKYITQEWLDSLYKFPLSRRKMEWNFRGGERNIWDYIIQLRPSGVRVRKITTTPALVAMTSTQVPILGPYHRFLTKIEGLRLQGFNDDHILPKSYDKSFQALGNAVHVKVVQEIAKLLFRQSNLDYELINHINKPQQTFLLV